MTLAELGMAFWHDLAAILMRWDPVLMIYTLAMWLPVCRYYPVLLVQSV